LLADFPARIPVLKRFGGAGAQHDGALAGWIGGVVAGLGIGLGFHILKLAGSFATQAAEKFRRPRAVSFRFEILVDESGSLPSPFRVTKFFGDG